jgi:hypothetical protein
VCRKVVQQVFFSTLLIQLLEIEEEESECEESEQESDVSEDEFSSANESDVDGDVDHWYVACA